MQLSRILSIVESVAPPAAAQSWDNTGIQVASTRTNVENLAVCLDPTAETIGKAIAQGADAVLCHHPLLLHPRLPDRLDDYRSALALLLGGDVALYAAHTSLDANPQGPAGWLAQDLGMTGLAVLEQVTAAAGGPHPLGLGIVGDLPAPVELQALVAALSASADPALMTLCGPSPTRISRLAYCTGSGASLLDAATDAGAQLYVTGDIKYHTALAAGIAVLDVGHHSLEEEMMRRMSLLLAQRLPDVRIIFVPTVSPFRPATSDGHPQEDS